MDVWRRGMLKVMVVVAMRMAAGRSQGCGERGAMWAANKQLVESAMWATSEHQGYTWHRRMLIGLSNDTDGFNAFDLRFDQGYRAACVLASTNE